MNSKKKKIISLRFPYFETNLINFPHLSTVKFLYSFMGSNCSTCSYCQKSSENQIEIHIDVRDSINYS